MVDIITDYAQVLSLSLSLGGLLLLALAWREKTNLVRTHRPVQQPVPVRVQHDLRER